MAIMVDLKELVWKDADSGILNKIMNFEQHEDGDLVWYMEIDSLDVHCMSIDIFVAKHIACGIFDDIESLY